MPQSQVYNLIKIPYKLTTNKNIPDAMEYFILPYKKGKYLIYFTRKGLICIADKPFINKIDTDTEEVLDLFRYLKKQPTAIIPKISNRISGFSLELTSACNLRCTYCYAHGGDNPKYMNWKTAKAAIDYAIKNYGEKTFELDFHGAGEQTIAFDMMKRCYEYAKKKCKERNVEIIPTITTNGIISEEVVKWFKKVNMHILLSFDGTPKIQNLQRPLANGGESYPVLENTIRLFNKYKVIYQVNVVISNTSIKKMTEIIKYLKDMGIKRCQFSMMRNWGRCKVDLLSESDRLFKRELGKCTKFAMNNKMTLYTTGDSLSFEDGLYTQACGGCGEMMFVRTDGIISSCHIDATSLKPSNVFIYGKIKNGKIIINKSKLKNLKHRTVDNVKECKTCWAKYICSGGCLLDALNNRGDIFKVDKNSCQFVRNTYIYPELLNWIEKAEPIKIRNLR